MSNEEWKILTKYSSYDTNEEIIFRENYYEISNFGNCRVISTNRILSNKPKQNGDYIMWGFTINTGQRRNLACHRLVATYFLKEEFENKQQQNPNEKLQVNHKDRYRYNNDVNNLEWVTQSENIKHSWDTNKNRKIGGRSRIIIKTDKSGKILQTYETLKECAKQNKISKDSLRRLLKNNKLYKDEFYFKDNIQSDLENEIWKDYKDKYLVSNKGRVKTKDGQLAKLSDNKGYKYAKINGKSFPVHRLVATYFLQKEFEIKQQENLGVKLMIDHIDGDKSNNDVSNLEWVTQSENVNRALENNPRTDIHKRTHYKLDLDGTIIEEITGISENLISSIASNYHKNFKEAGRHTYGGYVYCWKESYRGRELSKSLLNIFPTITLEECTPDILNKLRKYVENSIKPLWKKDIDGTRLEIIDQTKDLSDERIQITQKLKYNTPLVIDNNVFCIEYADWKDIINPNRTYKKIPVKLPIPIDWSKIVDKELLKYHLITYESNTIKAPPVWKIDPITGERLKKYSSSHDAEKQQNLGRETVNNCVRGVGMLSKIYIYEPATWYKEDDDYIKIPHKDRINGKKGEKDIIQSDMNNNIVKIWRGRNPRKQIKVELGYYISMSNVYNGDYKFEYE